MNKKQFGVTILLLFLMGCIVVGQGFFKDKMVNLNIKNEKYNTYTILDKEYYYNLPNDWEIEERSYPGNLIIYHNDFKNTDDGVTGYIELMDDKKSLDEIVERNNKIIKDNERNNNVSVEKFKIENYSGKKIKYQFKASTGTSYVIREYIYKVSDNHVVKYKFAILEDKFNDESESKIELIVDKFRK